MGLDYLNKKVWHPGSMKNIQKVWDAQQAQLQVIKRQKQRAKKLQDQQYNQQMKRIQVQAGLIPRSHLDRMDWMYDWGNKLQQQKNNQQFITGSKKVGKKQVKHIFQQQATNKKCQDFVLTHQDPLYQIKQKQMKARESIMNNPVQMRSIIREVEQDYLKMHRKNKKQKQGHKKHKKQTKSTDYGSSPQRLRRQKQKSSKRRQHSSSSSSSSSSNSSSSSSSSKERERSRDKYKNKEKSKSSKLYEDYLKSKFGSILKKDQDGNLVPDYKMHQKKYKTQMQMDQQQRRQKLDEMRQNARRIRERNDRSRSRSRSQSIQKQRNNYQRGLANIKQKSYESVSSNRNKQRHRERSQSN